MTFRVEVNYVEIDANVIDAQGNPVTRPDTRGLPDRRGRQAADAHRLSRTLDCRSSAPIRRCSRSTPSSPTCAATAREFDGRIFVLMLDDLHTSFQRTRPPARRRAAFVQRHIGANDVAAVVYTSSATARRAGLHQQPGAAAPRGRQVIGTETAVWTPWGWPRLRRDPRARRTAADRRAIRTKERGLQGRAQLFDAAPQMSPTTWPAMHGRRKSMVLFSEGINYDVSKPRQQHRAHRLDAADLCRRHPRRAADHVGAAAGPTSASMPSIRAASPADWKMRSRSALRRAAPRQR